VLQAFQQELESRQGMVQLMRSTTGDSSVAAQLDELGGVWERVNQLSDVRETRLQEALKLAEEFNEAVQVIRDWLPQAEAELKFRALPEDEDAIIQLIDNHEVGLVHPVEVCLIFYSALSAISRESTVAAAKH
jgi:dystonin